MNKFASLIVAVMTTFAINQSTLLTAHAEQQEVCIAVYPCLDNGELNPIYDVKGFCGDKWRAQCEAEKTSQITDELVACQKLNDNAASEIAALKREIAKLKRKANRKN